jgi:hypothetical protein
MKNITICTYYKTENCGTQLQAYALNHILKDIGNISFAPDPLCIIGRMLKVSINSFLRGEFKGVSFYIRRYFIFKFSKINQHKVISLKKGRTQDIIILGSDQIWSLGPSSIKSSYLWMGIDGVPYISYAPTINNATQEALAKLPMVVESFINISAISVRDSYTKKIIEQIVHKPVSLVCDPTMLFTRDFYTQLESDCLYEQFILVYDFRGRINNNNISKIKKFASNQKKLLVSILDYLPWCDKNIPVSPEQFLSYYAKADYIITSTFHGTIFALIYQKQFICYAENNNKVVEILNQFDLQKINASNSSLKINALFAQKIDYNTIQSRIDTLRQYSLEWLFSNIDRYAKNNGE